MATITAAMVKDLRETTGRRHDGLLGRAYRERRRHAAAIDWLRKKGLSKAAKKAGRVAAEGLIGALTAGTKVRCRGGSIPRPISSRATASSRDWSR